MKKILTFIDLGWELLLPFLACIFLVYNDSAFSGQIITYGWVMYIVHAYITLALFRENPPAINVLLSFINGISMLTLVILGIMGLKEYFIVALIGESVSIVGAIMFFLLFKKGVDGQSAWKSLGAGLVLMNFVIFSATAYPFVREWLIVLDETQTVGLVWIGSLAVFFISIWKKVTVIGQIVEERKIGKPRSSNASVPLDKKIESGSNPGLPVLIFLLIWFGTLVTLYFVR